MNNKIPFSTEPNSWNLTPRQAIQIQKDLAGKVIRSNEFGRITNVTGVDVGFENGGEITRAAVCTLDGKTLQPIEAVVAKTKTSFPYIPGLLSFREIPAILEALKHLQHKPELLFCDGQGYAHPRRFGIACHLGVITDIPSIGVGKSRLTGKHIKTPVKTGEYVDLMHNTERIGAVLCTRDNVKPLFISTGHKVALDTAVELVMHYKNKYRLPEPTRLADQLASRKPSKIFKDFKNIKVVDLT